MEPSSVSGLVSIVVLVRDRVEHTRRLVASLARATGEWELVVVDNGSTDGTAALLAGLGEALGRPVVVLSFPDDRGGAERRNAGAGAARGEFLLFLDNDVLVDDAGLVEVLAAELAGEPRLAAVSPLLCYPGELSLVQCAGGGSTPNGLIGLVGRGQPVSARHRERREQTWAPTAALMVRRSAFRAVGGFDEAFDPVPLCEDVDLCLRLRAAGGGVRFVGAVVARHFEGTTFNHVGHDKLAVWKRHTRVLRARWAREFAEGPRHGPAELAWVPVRKDYRDLDAPRAWVEGSWVEGTGAGSAGPAGASGGAGGAVGGAGPVVDPGGGPAGDGAGLGAAEPGTRPVGAAGGPGAGFFTSDRELAGLERADVRVSVLGARASLAALAATPGVRITGVSDRDAGELARRSREHGVRWALREDRDAVELVPAEGVVGDRLDLAELALRRGSHALLEAPLVGGPAELAGLLGRARTAEARCSVLLPWAHHPELAALGKAVAEGRIGAPTSFVARVRAPGGDPALDVLDAAERALGGPVELVAGLGPTRARVRVAGVPGVLEAGRGPRSLRVVITGEGGELTAEPPFDGPDGALADFVALLRGGPVPLTDVVALGPVLAARLAWVTA
ncbi:glycosyltransferase [Actinosynnema pretiosum subsp. pretiosum]|uniref:Glycosyltransferase n=1 Tax=Actinosynnema pretiosum subsp. pretiosum TaxID=103721 RepID=A0AA45R4I8_9PSEU|nr:glycosyltransferase [Actinosynnema pretiosum subsp. pretiosum]